MIFAQEIGAHTETNFLPCGFLFEFFHVSVGPSQLLLQLLLLLVQLLSGFPLSQEVGLVDLRLHRHAASEQGPRGRRWSRWTLCSRQYLGSEDRHRLQGAFLLLHLLLQFVDQVLLQRQRSLRLLQSAAQVASLPKNAHISVN